MAWLLAIIIVAPTPCMSAKYKMGDMAAKVLINIMQGNYALPFKMLMPYEIIVHQSSTLKIK